MRKKQKKISINIEKMQSFYDFFVKERNWTIYHNPKNLSMALSVEVSELVEIFQWLNEKQSLNVMRNPKTKQSVEEEIADIFSYLIRLAHILNIDLDKIFWKKFEKNKKKYPIKKAKQLAKKQSVFFL